MPCFFRSIFWKSGWLFYENILFYFITNTVMLRLSLHPRISPPSNKPLCKILLKQISPRGLIRSIFVIIFRLFPMTIKWLMILKFSHLYKYIMMYLSINILAPKTRLYFCNLFDLSQNQFDMKRRWFIHILKFLYYVAQLLRQK